MESSKVLRTSVSSNCSMARSSMDSNKENKLTAIQYQEMIRKCKENHLEDENCMKP